QGGDPVQVVVERSYQFIQFIFVSMSSHSSFHARGKSASIGTFDFQLDRGIISRDTPPSYRIAVNFLRIFRLNLALRSRWVPALRNAMIGGKFL
ncbi:MAG: hypothetical protein L0Z53_07935, partial [Acidobacteriales bacterium]|nr:hypothetical protein [Terriglobales bacterium]